MITKEVKYENFDGVEVTETLHFHLSINEMREISVTEPEFLTRMFNAVKNDDTSELYKIFKTIVLAAYGKKLDAGTFVKDENTKNFEYTLAFAALMDDIVSDSNTMFAFIKGILPKTVSDQLPATPAVYTEEKKKELIEELEKKIDA